MSSRILLVTPSFKQKGGVVEFNKLLLKYGASRFKVLQLSSGLKQTTPGKLLALSSDSIRFILLLLFTPVDIVHLNPSLGRNAVRRDGSFLRIAKRFNKKVYVHWHGWNPDNEYLLKAKDLEFFQKTFFKADHIKVLSEQIRQKISEAGFKGKLTLGNTFFDDEVISDAHTFHSNGGNIRLLFLSTVSKNKGIYTSLEVFEKLQNNYPDLELLIAGEGPELQRVKEHVQSKTINGITFCGHVEGAAKKELFLKSTIYLFPSSYEGMPTSVLEAMGFGLPVVCSNVGALPDFFQQGKMGSIIHSNQADDYVTAIEDLLHNPELTTSIAAFNSNYAREHFTASKSVAVIEQDYKLLAGNN